MNEEFGAGQELVTLNWRAYMRCRDGCGAFAPCNHSKPRRAAN
jgi:hypothetical protein